MRKYSILFIALILTVTISIFGCTRSDGPSEEYYFQVNRNGDLTSFTRDINGGEAASNSGNSSTTRLVVGATKADSSETMVFAFEKVAKDGVYIDSVGNPIPNYRLESFYIRAKDGSFLTDDLISGELNKITITEKTSTKIKGEFSCKITYVYPAGKKNTITNVKFAINRKF